MTRLIFILNIFLSPILVIGQNELSFPNGGDLCQVKQTLNKNSEAIRAAFNVNDSITNFTYTLPNEYWLSEIKFPLNNKRLLKSYFGTSDSIVVNDSIIKINEMFSAYNDTLNFFERRSGLHAICVEGEFCLIVKYSPIYNNVFMVNIYQRIEKDNWGYDISKNKVQYLYVFDPYGDIQDLTLIKTIANKK